jgi:hypothetical protein
LEEEKKAGELFVEGDGAGFCEQLTGKESRAIIENRLSSRRPAGRTSPPPASNLKDSDSVPMTG